MGTKTGATIDWTDFQLLSFRERGELSGLELAQVQAMSNLPDKQFWRVHLQSDDPTDPGISYGAYKGKSWRQMKGLNLNANHFRNRLGDPPIMLDGGSFCITGDWQIPTMDYYFAALPIAITERHIKKGERNFVIAGDFINADFFSVHDKDYDTATFEEEAEAAQAIISEILTVADHVYVFTGNHERRISKRTNNAIKIKMLKGLLVYTQNLPNVTWSHWGHMVIKTPNKPFRISHARNYSVNPGVVPNDLANKYKMNIVQHHEHSIGLTMDRWGRYVIANNGGIFKDNQMGYAFLDDSKSPTMKQGFSLLRDGYLDVLAEFTDWDRWMNGPAPGLEKQRRRSAA